MTDVPDTYAIQVVLPAGPRLSFEVIEAQFGLQLLVLLFDRLALMGEPRKAGERGVDGEIAEKVLCALARSHSSHTSRTRRRRSHSAATVTRAAQKSAVHGGWPPFCQRIGCHAAGGACAAKVSTARAGPASARC